MSQAVERAIDVLELCAERPRTMAELAEQLDVHRTTVQRLVNLLAGRGILARSQGGRYRIGLRLGALSHGAMEDVELRQVAYPHLARLADDLGFSVHLAAPMFGRIISIVVIEPPYAIRLPLRVGGTVMMHIAGIAKAILAFLPDEEKDALLKVATWERYTDRTIVSREEMDRVLEKVRRDGWGADTGEYEESSNSIAAPVFDHTGAVAGAVSITGFKDRTPIPVLQQHLPRLMDTTRGISRDLGWREAGTGTR